MRQNLVYKFGHSKRWNSSSCRSENMFPGILDFLKHILKISQNCFIFVSEYAKSNWYLSSNPFSVHGENCDFTMVLFTRSRLRIRKTITENTFKTHKRIRRICQACFAVYREYTDRHKTEPISANFRPKAQKKIQLLPPKLLFYTFLNG